MIIGIIDWTNGDYQSAVALIVLAPLIWNIIARMEHATWFLRKLTRSNFLACYIIALWVFGFSLYRDYYFHKVLWAAEPSPVLDNVVVQVLAAVLCLLGQVLVISSFWQLGITGTFLGDYCGILMDSPVTKFPFSVMSNPMYTGSSVSFLGSALWHRSLAGVTLSILIFFVYQIALFFEEPFTAAIYAARAEKKST